MRTYLVEVTLKTGRTEKRYCNNVAKTIYKMVHDCLGNMYAAYIDCDVRIFDRKKERYLTENEQYIMQRTEI